MAPIWRLARVKATVIASDDPLVREGEIIMCLTARGRKKTRMPRFRSISRSAQRGFLPTTLSYDLGSNANPAVGRNVRSAT
jgi:hypothetical protein